MSSKAEAKKGISQDQQKASDDTKFLQKITKSLTTVLFGEDKYCKINFTIVVSIIVVIFVFWIDPQAATSDIILLLSSSTVALIGVSITGYIFSSDSLRKHADDDYKYIYAAEEHKKGILDQLKIQFAVAVIFILFFTVIAHFETQGVIS